MTPISWPGLLDGFLAHDDTALLMPLHMREPQHFILPDIFDAAGTNGRLNRIFAVMALCPQHEFTIRTKHSVRSVEYIFTQQTLVRVKAGNLAFDLFSLAKFDDIPDPTNAPIVYDLGAKGDECGCRVQMQWPLPNVRIEVRA